MLPANFNKTACQDTSDKKKFGLCDDPPPAKNPAYIDELDSEKWIAVVHNDRNFEVLFTAIDNCIVLKRADGNMDKRCDGMLSYFSDALGETVIFVELKERADRGPEWVKRAETQLRATINHFEDTEEASSFKVKKVYAANSFYPKYRASQMERMDKFYEETRYVLRVENRIVLD